MTLTLFASVSRMPQLVIGGRQAETEEAHAVSPRIIPGMEIVAVAMRWDMKPGTRWRP